MCACLLSHLTGEHDWLSWWAIGVGQLSARARREIHHRESSCLSLALDKWAQMKPVCLCVCVCLCTMCSCVCLKSLYACRCASWLRSVTKLNTRTKSEAILFFALQGDGRVRDWRKEAKGTRGGGIVFPPCVHYGWGASTAFDQWFYDGLKVLLGLLSVCVFVGLSVCDHDRDTYQTPHLSTIL